MKKFNKFEIATIKRTAQNVNPIITKKAKIKNQINALQEEYNKLDALQEQYEASIKIITGGYSTEDIVEKIIEDTGHIDKNGKPIKVTKYLLKYPTIIPPDEKNENIINEQTDSSEVNQEVEIEKNESPLDKILAGISFK